MTMETRNTGFTVDPNDLMEKSGRQIAEDALKHWGLDCKITSIESTGTDGGHWCFYVGAEMDAASAAKWDKML